ncbi:hypothetical protein KK062_15760 [Fulvivirgaceae bacterium PWU5]|uniref:Uncharacterized protein n=1 Tax=Dawidia cretensis TaxID=2782350 RepID=A0AAP2E1B2_9BACT|nr:hypothetical protein [Dawidia cretensis]MBT1709699.1 hypothetical protein [Dawidia cretensis]
MRNPYLPVAWLTASTITLGSCTFDDASRFNNQFIVDGKSYALVSGIAIAQPDPPAEESTVQVWSVTLDSPGKARKIHSVSFDLYTDAAEMLPEGTYTFDAEHVQTGQTFYHADATVNYDRERQEGGQVYKELDGGTVTIRLLDEARRDYAISFDLSLNQRRVKGYYRGVVEVAR